LSERGNCAAISAVAARSPRTLVLTETIGAIAVLTDPPPAQAAPAR
jgi:hypothetical protein